MVSSALRAVSLIACAIVLLGYGLFAVDETRDASEQSRAGIVDRPDPTPRAERLRERDQSGLRELIDDGNDLLLSPFTGIAHADDLWVDRTVPLLLALAVYGFGLGYLARWSSARA